MVDSCNLRIDRSERIFSGVLTLVLSITSFLWLLLVTILAVELIRKFGGELRVAPNLSLRILPILERYGFYLSALVPAFQILVGLYFAIRKRHKLYTLIMLELSIAFLVFAFCALAVGACLVMFI
jgi:uncharacterized membrane protein